MNPSENQSTILVIDDTAAQLEVMALLLTRSGYRVLTAGDGPEGLEIAEREAPNLIVSDVTMPMMDGIELCRRVRAHSKLRRTPVLLVSALRKDSQSAVEGMRAGADDYLEAPYDSEHLIKKIERLIEQARAEEALRLSAAQTQTLFDEAPVGIYLVDSNFRIRQVNPKALPVFGDIPDLIGRDFDEIIHILWSQAYADELVERFRHTLETGESYYVPERIEQRRDSNLIEYYEWQINRITLPEGCYGVVCYFRDVSARVFARQAIAESEERYRTLFNSIDEGFCIVEMIFDGDGKPIDCRFVEVNPSFEKQTGIENAVGKRMREIAPRHEEHWFEIYGRVALTGDPACFENYAARLHRWFYVYAFRFGEAEKLQVAILFNDITERKRNEIDLHLQAQILGQVNDAVIAIDSHQRITYLNQAAERQYGLESGWALGRTLQEVYEYRWERPEDEADANEALASKGSWRGENIHVRHDGRELHVESAVRVLKNEVGEVTGMLAVIRDITERRMTEVALRESEERFRAMFEQASVGIVQITLDGRMEVPNPGFCKIIGYTEEEARRMRVRDVTHPEDYEKEAELMRQIISGEIPSFLIEKRYVRKDGQMVWGQMTTKLVRYATGEPVYALAIVEDITERRRAEDELRRAHDEMEQRVEERTRELRKMAGKLLDEVKVRTGAEVQVRELLRRIVNIQEEERRRLARELHDNLGQQLTALRLGLGPIRQETWGRKGLVAQVDRFEGILGQLDSEVDFMAWELRPASLDQLGLAETLAQFVRQWSEHTNVVAEFHGRLDDARLTPEAETSLYRITQEALNNIQKHAGATNVSVLLECRDKQAKLIVEDNGHGFDLKAAASEGVGMGLINMRERAAIVGGTMEIESAPEGGTTIYVRVPVAPEGGMRKLVK